MSFLRRFSAKISEPYRLTVTTVNTYEQKGTYILKIKYLIYLGVGFSILVGFFTWLLFWATPLKKTLPGFSDSETLAKLNEIITKQNQYIARQDTFIRSMQRMTGVPDSVLRRTSINTINETVSESPKSNKSTDSDEHTQPKADQPQKAVKPAVQDPTPVALTSNNPSTGLASKQFTEKMIQLVKPVEGVLTRSYNPNANHYAIDIAAPENSMIRAAADGFVVISDYTAETGYVIGVQHRNNLISFYKHNSRIFKKVGTYVFAGEAIATIGNSGENTTGPHLHFELWRDGKPLNPLDYFVYSER